MASEGSKIANVSGKTRAGYREGNKHRWHEQRSVDN